MALYSEKIIRYMQLMSDALDLIIFSLARRFWTQSQVVERSVLEGAISG